MALESSNTVGAGRSSSSMCLAPMMVLRMQERHVHGLLEGALEEHMGRLRGMTQRIADKAAADARFKELQHLEEVRPSISACCFCLAFCRLVCSRNSPRRDGALPDWK